VPIGRLIAGIALALLAGCAATPPAIDHLTVAPGGYPSAFEAAKDTLRDFEFELDRVDAREGVITTAPRAWSGAATPWLPYTSAPRDAIEGLGQFEQRTARVEFTSDDPAPASGDLRDYPGEVRARVSVAVERLYRPGRRVDATSIRLAGFTADPRETPSGPPPAFAVEHREDPALAARIQKAIDRALSTGAPSSEPAEPSTTQP
jgi:hypothetical protein